MSSRSLVCVMMHGEAKLRREGLRTRDAHLVEWIGRLWPELLLVVRSRPEPWPRLTLARSRGGQLPPGWQLQSPEPLTVPLARDRRRWWVTSTRYEASWPETDAAIVWNPIAGAAGLAAFPNERPLLLDLLDDWTIHPAFTAIVTEVQMAYAKLFARATHVTANSEGTLELARRFGRNDAVLVTNGCDPGRFDRMVEPHARFTVGYGGKIGGRLDTQLIRAAAERFPAWDFELVGPVLEREIRSTLRDLTNVRFLGDIPYARYPAVMRRWDIAWVPHRTGDGEFGGDAIKLYEYRAAGLPAVATRIIGWERALPGVRTSDSDAIVDLLRSIAGPGTAGSVSRDQYSTPESDTWRCKAARIGDLCGLPARSG